MPTPPASQPIPTRCTAQRRMAIPTDPDGDARPLDWQREEGDLIYLVVIALMRNRLTAKQPVEYIQAFVKHVGADFRISILQSSEFLRDAAQPDGEDHPSLAEQVERGQRLSQYLRAAAWQRRNAAHSFKRRVWAATADRVTQGSAAGAPHT